MRWWVVHKRLSYTKEKSVSKDEYFSSVEKSLSDILSWQAALSSLSRF